MSAADLMARIDTARGDHQRASDLLAEARSMGRGEEPQPTEPQGGGLLDALGGISGIGHTVLDVAGMIPIVGSAADLINAGWYAAEGDYVNAGLSALGAVPGVGDAAIAAKLANTAAIGLAGAVAAARNADNARDVAANMARVDQARQQFNIGKGRNVALADVHLDGIDSYTLPPAASGRHSPKGTVGLPDNPVFKTFETPPGHARNLDSEYKLLEKIAAQVTNNPNPRGTVNLFTERPPCPSCRFVKEQFEEKFPNIKVNLTHGNRRD